VPDIWCGARFTTNFGCRLRTELGSVDSTRENRTTGLTHMMTRALLLVTSFFTFALPLVAQGVSVNIVSDDTWTVYDNNGNNLNNAQNVCLNPTANCPAGAMSYGYMLPGWTADLSSIPGGKWIWATKSAPNSPNITGTTSPAAFAEFSFQKQSFFVVLLREEPFG
jgi:hypothetical protein